MSTQLPFSWPRVLAKCCRLSAGGRRVRVQISPPDYAEVSPMHEIPSARRLVVAPSSPQPKSPSAPASDSYLNSPRSLKAGAGPGAPATGSHQRLRPGWWRVCSRNELAEGEAR
jgi:hypothetical protein